MLVDSQKSDQSTPEIDDAELAKLGGWQKQEVESVKQRSQANPSQPLPLLDEDDTVTPFKDALKVRDDQHPTVEFVITSGLGHRNIYRSSTVKKTIFEFFCQRKNTRGLLFAFIKGRTK